MMPMVCQAQVVAPGLRAARRNHAWESLFVVLVLTSSLVLSPLILRTSRTYLQVRRLAAGQ